MVVLNTGAPAAREASSASASGPPVVSVSSSASANEPVPRLSAALAPASPDSVLDEDEERLWNTILRVSSLPGDRSPSLVAPASPTPSSARELPEPSATSSVANFVPMRLQALIDEREREESGDESKVDQEDDATSAAQSGEDVLGAGLFDDSDDEEIARPALSRVRRGVETSAWHPPLPDAPERHPTTNHRNHYDKDAPWDYDVEVAIVRLLDVWGEAPHRCYLVQWKGRPLQMSWIWMEQLDKPSTRFMMRQVDEWKASGTTETLMEWSRERDSASAAGTCFMDAFRSALYYLGSPNLVTMTMWGAFEDTRPPVIQYGVTREDVTEFFKLLQRQSVPLNYDHLHKNLLDTSIANIKTLLAFCGDLAPGAYVVSDGQDGVGHCFVVISRGPGKRLLALDHFDEEKDPPMMVLPLSHQQWVEHVKWIARVELKPGYQCRHGKRKSKTQRKREKRMKQKDQQQ